MAAGDTVTKPAGDDGVPMIEGHPDEPVGPEDAAGPGPKRGDYSDRGDGKLAGHYEYRADSEGNLDVLDQDAAMAETPAVADVGEKGGVNTESGSEAEGATPDNEVQTLTVDATGGTYDIGWPDGDEATGVAEAASAATLETALEGIAEIGSGNVSVTGSDGGPYTIEFVGDLAGTDVPLLVTDATSLTGGASTAVVVETTKGGPAQAD